MPNTPPLPPTVMDSSNQQHPIEARCPLLEVQVNQPQHAANAAQQPINSNKGNVITMWDAAIAAAPKSPRTCVTQSKNDAVEISRLQQHQHHPAPMINNTQQIKLCDGTMKVMRSKLREELLALNNCLGIRPLKGNEDVTTTTVPLIIGDIVLINTNACDTDTRHHHHQQHRDPHSAMYPPSPSSERLFVLSPDDHHNTTTSATHPPQRGSAAKRKSQSATSGLHQKAKKYEAADVDDLDEDLWTLPPPLQRANDRDATAASKETNFDALFRDEHHQLKQRTSAQPKSKQERVYVSKPSRGMARLNAAPGCPPLVQSKNDHHPEAQVSKRLVESALTASCCAQPLLDRISAWRDDVIPAASLRERRHASPPTATSLSDRQNLAASLLRQRGGAPPAQGPRPVFVHARDSNSDSPLGHSGGKREGAQPHFFKLPHEDSEPRSEPRQAPRNPFRR